MGEYLPRISVRLMVVTAIAVLAAVVAGFIVWVHVAPEPVSAIDYPRELPGGYPVIRVITGKKAASLVASIHWSPSRIPVVDAIIVEYSDGTRLWAVTVNDDACQVASRMAEKMRIYESQLPYTAPVLHSIGDTQVYLSMDKRTGGLHAFWCRGNIVAWVEVGSSGLNGLTTLIESVG